MKTSPEKVMIDTDMGTDDVIAITRLLLAPTIQIVGFSTVQGIADVTYGTRNLQNILSWVGRKIPIAQGMTNPLSGKSPQLLTKDEKKIINDMQFLGSMTIPQSAKTNLVSLQNLFFDETICKEPITVLCLGPLTNIAHLIKNNPVKSKAKIKQLVIMGGALKVAGNIPPSKHAEYNIWADPLAAKIVFESDIPKVLIALDVTNTVPTGVFDEGPVSKIAARKLDSIKKIKLDSPLLQLYHTVLLNMAPLNYYYDPLAACVLISDTCIKTVQKIGVGVITKGVKKGKTQIKTSPKTTHFVMKVNQKTFYDILFQPLKK